MDEPWFEARGKLSKVLEDFKRLYLAELTGEDLEKRVILRVLLDHEAAGEEQEALEEGESKDADWLKEKILDLVRDS